MHSQGFNSITSRISCRDSRQGGQYCKDGSLLGRLLKITVLRVYASLLQHGLRLYLMPILMCWHLRYRGCCSWTGSHVVTVTGLLHNVSLLDVGSWHLYLLLRHVIVVLVLRALIIGELRLVLPSCRVFGHRAGILWGLAWDVLFAILVLLQFYARDCRLIGLRTTIRLMTGEVFRSSLVPYIVDLRDFFASSIRIINITGHISIALIVVGLRCRLMSLILHYFYSFGFLLWIFLNCDFLFLHDNVALLIWFHSILLSFGSFFLLLL